MLNLLGEVFRKSQDVTVKEFIAKLEQRGIEYTVCRIDTGTYITVGRFGYRFGEVCHEAGGLETIRRTGRRIGNNGRPCSAKVMTTILQSTGKQIEARDVLVGLLRESPKDNCDAHDLRTILHQA